MQSFLEQLFIENVIIQKLHHCAVTVGFNRKLNLIMFAFMLLKEVLAISGSHLMYALFIIKIGVSLPCRFNQKLSPSLNEIMSYKDKFLRG